MTGKPLGDSTPVSPLDYEAEDDASSVQSTLSQQVRSSPLTATCGLCIPSSNLETAAKLVSASSRTPSAIHGTSAQATVYVDETATVSAAVLAEHLRGLLQVSSQRLASLRLTQHEVEWQFLEEQMR